MRTFIRYTGRATRLFKSYFFGNIETVIFYDIKQFFFLDLIKSCYINRMTDSNPIYEKIFASRNLIAMNIHHFNGLQIKFSLTFPSLAIHSEARVNWLARIKVLFYTFYV